MINANNYFSKIESIGVDTLPPTLQKSHEYVVKATHNGTSWESYKSSDTIKKVIDLYFQKVDEFIGTLRTKPVSKTKKKSLVKEKPKKEEVLNNKAYALLTKFIPGLIGHLKQGEKSGVLEVDEYGRKRKIKYSFNKGFEGETPEYRFALEDELNGEKELQYDVTLYPDKKEAEVTAEWISFYYEDKYGRDEDFDEEEDDIGEAMTSSMCLWLEHMLNKKYSMIIDGAEEKKETDETKKVERISEEVKFIKRFVGLHNKIKSPQSILSFIKAMQRAIVQKLIRKTSPFAEQIELIQERLIAIYKKMRGDTGMTISENELSKLVAIAGGEQVYPSLNIIKRYIGLQGKPMENDVRERFIRQIEKALDTKIMNDDPYADKVKSIHATLRKTKNNKTFSVSASELNGLEGIVKACGCHKEIGSIYHIKRSQAVNVKKKLRQCRKKTFSDARGKGTCSHNGGLSGVLTAEEMANRKLDLLNFTSIWLSLFGRVGKNFTMMFHGEPYNGKTIFLLKLAQYLAENFGNVLYVSSEEFSSPTMTKKVNQFLNPRPSRLHFSENLTDPDLSMYEFVILDSVNDLKLKISDFEDMRKEHPNTAVIFILQHTKAGDFKGGKDWEHKAEIVGEVSKGILTITKNRYAPMSMLNFFEQFGIQWEEPKESIQPIQLLPESNSMVTTEQIHY